MLAALMLTEKEGGHRGPHNLHCHAASLSTLEAAKFRGRIIIYGRVPNLRTQRPGRENSFSGTHKLRRVPI